MMIIQSGLLYVVLFLEPLQHVFNLGVGRDSILLKNLLPWSCLYFSTTGGLPVVYSGHGHLFLAYASRHSPCMYTR